MEEALGLLPIREMADVEPIVFSWKGGEVSVGYLGCLRWRVTGGPAVAELADARRAATHVLDQVFKGASPGCEVAERAPIRIHLPDEDGALHADPKMVNGWSYSGARLHFDIGPHDELLPFVTKLLTENADAAWGFGVEPQRPTPLGQEFSFEAFSNAPDRGALCRQLASVVAERLRGSAHPPAALELAIKELEDLGHNLWSWDAERVWGWDYVMRRPGAGLIVTRSAGEDEDENTREEVVAIEFRPPG